MKIQYCSDLHLEFDDNRDYLDTHPISCYGDILVLAGDIIPFSHISKANYFFDEVSEAFEAVYWIPGNHEYYFGDISGYTWTFNKDIRPNVHLINNQVILLGNTRLLCSTMWTKISEQKGYRISSIMNDFRVISAGNHSLTIADYNRLHEESINFLSAELYKPFDGNTVVVTHHIPTFDNYPKEYKGSVLNESFCC